MWSITVKSTGHSSKRTSAYIQKLRKNCIIKLYFYIKVKHKLFIIFPICQNALKNITPPKNFKDV